MMKKSQKKEALKTALASLDSLDLTLYDDVVTFCNAKILTLALVIAVLLTSPRHSQAYAQVLDPESQFNEAVAAQQSGQFQKALEVYESLIHRFPQNIAVRINLAGLLVELGRLDEAVMNYRAGLKIDPTNLDLRFGLDATFVDKDDNASLKAAASDLERFRAENPLEPTATKILAEVYDRQQRYSAVLELLQPLEAQLKEDDDFEVLLGRAMLQVGQRTQGLTRMDQVALRSDRADAYLAAGQVRLTMSQFDLAKKDAEAAIAKQPNLAGAETLLGSVLERMGDYEGAGDALRKALSEDPKDFDANYDLGSLRYFDRDLQGASAVLEQALRLRPFSSEARYKLALVQQSRGETQAALDNLERVTRERPDWMEPHAKLSALYFQVRRQADGEREAKAVEALVAKGMGANPKSP